MQYVYNWNLNNLHENDPAALWCVLKIWSTQGTRSIYEISTVSFRNSSCYLLQYTRGKHLQCNKGFLIGVKQGWAESAYNSPQRKHFFCTDLQDLTVKLYHHITVLKAQSFHCIDRHPETPPLFKHVRKCPGRSPRKMCHEFLQQITCVTAAVAEIQTLTSSLHSA